MVVYYTRGLTINAEINKLNKDHKKMTVEHMCISKWILTVYTLFRYI